MKHAVVAGAMIWAAALPAWGQSKQEVCAAYAQRAVQQYQLMKSHPGCEQHLDALSWRDDYAYHYNGCMTFGNVATTLSEQGREGHLRACGALSDSSSAAAASTSGTAGTGSTAPAGAAATAPPDPTATQPANVSPGSGDASASLVTPAPHYGGIGCHAGPALSSRQSGNGRVVDLKGNALTYHAFPPATPSTTAQSQWAMANSYPLVTAIVARPQFYPTCTGIPAVSALGPWIATGEPGQSSRYIWVDVGGTLAWQEISSAEAKALLTTGKLPTPAATSAAVPKSNKTTAPVKPAQSKTN